MTLEKIEKGIRYAGNVFVVLGGVLLMALMFLGASDVIGRNPVALQLRFLQTLAEIATENSSTIVFPVPIDILKAFMKEQEK